MKTEKPATKHDIELLEHDIQQLERKLGGDIKKLDEKLDVSVERLDKKIGALDEKLDVSVERVRTELTDEIEDLALMMRETMVSKDEFYDFQNRAFETFATKEDLKAYLTRDEFHATMDYVITAIDSIAKDVKDIKGELVFMNANHQRLVAIVEFHHPSSFL